jgi:hypothetical protein
LKEISEGRTPTPYLPSPPAAYKPKKGCCGKNKKTTGVGSYIKAKQSGLAPLQAQQERFSICQKCTETEEHKENKPRLFREIKGRFYCGKPWITKFYRNDIDFGCGCNLREKVKYNDSACPRGHWKEVTSQ